MQGIEHLSSFLLAAFLVIVIPGPATLYVAGRAHRSVRHGGYAAAGIVAGDIVLITLSGIGFAALVAQWPMLLSFIKVGGGLYIAYLGWELLREPPATANDAPSAPNDAAFAHGGALAAFARGLLITLTNPKPILFFGAFFPMFISTGERSSVRVFYLLGALFEAVNLAYFAAIVAAMALLGGSAAFNRYMAGGFLRISGGILLLCACFMFASMLF